MEKFSVKKPFTILVAVIMVLLLGFVSITSLQTNLLPDISTPYLMVVTVYPGASPDRVGELQPPAHEVCRGHRHEQCDGQDLE